MILIFTNKEDSHPNPVIAHLEKMGVPVFRFNTEALLSDYDFSWWADASGCDFMITDRASGRSVKGSEVTAIWDRRPARPSCLLVENTPEINSHNLDEALGFLRFIRYYLKDIPSLGSIVNDVPAASKMLQMKVARKVGFKMPATCFANNKEAVLRHIDSADIILKPIESEAILDGGGDRQWTFFAQKTTLQDLRDVPDEAFSQTVSFVQEYVEKAFELRVTVVGNRIFACRIDSQLQQDDTGKIDWRQGYGNGIRWSVYDDLPETVSRQCLAFLRAMGLDFGCFDFVVTPSGEYVFLECNPNGQWLWVELETGLPISQAIAEWLARQKTESSDNILLYRK